MLSCFFSPHQSVAVPQSFSFMILTLLKSIDQLFCRLFLSMSTSDIFSWLGLNLWLFNNTKEVILCPFECIKVICNLLCLAITHKVEFLFTEVLKLWVHSQCCMKDSWLWMWKWGRWCLRSKSIYQTLWFHFIKPASKYLLTTYYVPGIGT